MQVVARRPPGAFPHERYGVRAGIDVWKAIGTAKATGNRQRYVALGRGLRKPLASARQVRRHCGSRSAWLNSKAQLQFQLEVRPAASQPGKQAEKTAVAVVKSLPSVAETRTSRLMAASLHRGYESRFRSAVIRGESCVPRQESMHPIADRCTLIQARRRPRVAFNNVNCADRTVLAIILAENLTSYAAGRLQVTRARRIACRGAVGSL